MLKTRLIQATFFILFIFILYKLLLLLWSPFRSIHAHEVIPSHIAAFFEVNNDVVFTEKWTELMQDKRLNEWSVLQKIPADLAAIASVFGASLEGIKKRKMAIALSKGRGDKLDFLYVLEGVKKRRFLKAINKDLTLQKHVFLDQNVYEIKLGEEQEISFTFYKNALVFARYAVLIEDAISQLNTSKTNLCHQKGFAQVYQKKCNENNINLYIQPAAINRLIRPFFQKGKRHFGNKMEGVFDWLFVEIDQAKNSDFATLNATAVPNKSNTIFPLLKSQSNRNTPFDLPLLLPNNSAVFQTFQVRDFGFLDIGGNLFYKEKIKPWIGDEAALLMTEPFSDNLQEELFVVLECKDMALAEKALFEGSDKAIINYNSFKINQLNIEGAFLENIEFAPKSMRNPYFIVLEKMVIFCNSLGALEVFIDKYTVNQTFGNDEAFLQLYGPLMEAGTNFMYCDPTQSTHLLQSWMEANRAPEIMDLMQLVGRINPLLFQSTIESNKHLLKGRMQVNKKDTQNTSVLWRFSLAEDAAIEPQVVTYKEDKAILVQDEGNTLYLITKGGKKIWQRTLEERVQSTVFEIDFYKNGEPFFLFNTRNKVYLLNQAGEDAKSYPFRLQSPASNGLIAIDFDHSKNYDFFVACDNGNIYGFDQKGKPLAGWNPNFNTGRIKQDFQHFQHDNKDYIVSVNIGSKMQVFQRNGKQRFEPVFLQESAHFAFDKASAAVRIVAQEKEGKVRIINPLGKSFKLPICPSSKSKTPFAFADLLGDARKDYFMVQDTLLCGKYYVDTALKESFQYGYEYPQDTLFAVQLKGQPKAALASLNKAKKQINLLDAKGQLFSNFPLGGTTSFEVLDLFGNGQNILIVGFDNSVYAYQIK